MLTQQHRFFAAAILLLATLTVSGATKFERVFAPQDGIVAPAEQPYRDEICLNGSWQFQADKDVAAPGEAVPPLGDWDKTAIKIPSPWNVNSFSMNLDAQGGDFVAYPSYPKEWENVRAAWMARTVNVPMSWSDKRVVLRFNAVAGDMVVYVNGKRAGQGFDIFFAQEFDVTRFVKLGAENQILIKGISPKVFDKRGRYGSREYLSGSFWGTHIAGIWQDVFLVAQPKTSVSDIFVQPWVDRDELRAEVTLSNHETKPVKLSVSGKVHEWINLVGKSVVETPEVKWRLADKPAMELPSQTIELAAGETRVVQLSAQVNNRLKLWGPAEPNLYGLVAQVQDRNTVIDAKYQRFGWRQFTVRGKDFLLNGQPIVLKGDSWHFMGVPQMTRRYAYAWYQLLKDAGANSVRLHASIYPSFYNDMADEMGIMVLAESAIWLSDGGPKADSELFWKNCRRHVESLVRRDRNHPSVFGWSICNEVLAVMRNVWHTPKNMIDDCLGEMSGWVKICETNDPTRGFISGDGEFDAERRIPTINIHYGGEGELRRASNSGKPWGVGETSMAYYGTPKQVAKFNGDRAYESPLGRMEGLAYECYSLLHDQQRFGGNYQSVFNIAWYGVQPLPLGKENVTKQISSAEGVFFAAYREGVPGMQPERLGPYTTTLNPGFDAKLPLYRPWPMLEAIRDANMGNTNSRWAKMPVLAKPVEVAAKTNGTAVLRFIPGNGERLAQQLNRTGAKIEPYSGGKTDFLLLDATTNHLEVVKETVEAVLEAGGTVWAWNVQPGGTSMLSQLLGGQVVVEPRSASSLVVKQPDALLAGVDSASLYFSEGDDWQQVSYALGGDFLSRGQVLLEACPAEWRRWNYKAEPVKTAALFRSEVENPGDRAALVVSPARRGRVILCNLSPEIRSERKADLVRRMFLNAGIQLGEGALQSGFVDSTGQLMRALVVSGPVFTNDNQAYTGKLPDGEVGERARFGGRRWTLHDADAGGVFDFKSFIRGEQDNTVAYLAFWVKSPKPLNDLLSEPNLPKLTFSYGSDDGCEIWLNGELLATHRRTGPMEPQLFTQDPVLLKLGWNQIVIKVVQNLGEWKFAGRFGCSDYGFLQKLEFAASKPTE